MVSRMANGIVITKNILTKSGFVNEMRNIKSMGFVSTHRVGPTGIGKTLEDLLGISENSISSPDIGDVELKAARENSNSMLTLTTKSPDERRANTRLRSEYGYQTEESKELNSNLNILHSTVNGCGFNNFNGSPYLKLTFQNDRVYLEHAIDGIIAYAYWSEQTLIDAFKRKYPNERLYYVKADIKEVNGKESFHYTDAYFLEHFSPNKMMANLKSGIIDIDIRLGIYTKGSLKGKAHDHGTGIRILPSKLELCFDTSEKIL